MIVLYEVAVTFTYVDQTVVCDHSNETYLAWLSKKCFTISQEVVETLNSMTIQMKAVQQKNANGWTLLYKIKS